MIIRYLLPLIAWIAIVLLLTLRVYHDPSWNWNGITGYSLIQCFLFLGFSHISLGVLKKQLRYENIRLNAQKITLISGIIFAILIETLRMFCGFKSYFNYVNLILDIIGVFLGIITFRLVYRKCC